MFDINAFILQLLLMANSYGAQGYSYDYTHGLNPDAFTPAVRPQAPERQRIRSQRGL